MSRLNPHASAFVPSWAPVSPIEGGRAAAPSASQTFAPPGQAASNQHEAVNSWDDEDAPVSTPTYSAPAPEEIPPQPTESVFKVEEDDLEDDEPEGTTLVSISNRQHTKFRRSFMI
jgi:hypothetical protein